RTDLALLTISRRKAKLTALPSTQAQCRVDIVNTRSRFMTHSHLTGTRAEFQLPRISPKATSL
ncbi:hypothetical protein J6590_088084, partial [Homalodisca vitripennis]